MPIFEYKCCNAKCGEVFEYLKVTSDTSDLMCPICGSEFLEKLMSASNFKFNGQGFHKTDYARVSSTKESKTRTFDLGNTK